MEIEIAIANVEKDRNTLSFHEKTSEIKMYLLTTKYMERCEWN